MTTLSRQSLLWGAFAFIANFLVFSMLSTGGELAQTLLGPSGAATHIKTAARLWKVVVFVVVQFAIARRVDGREGRWMGVGAIISLATVVPAAFLASGAAFDTATVAALMLAVNTVEAIAEALLVSAAFAYVRNSNRANSHYLRVSTAMRAGQNIGIVVSLVLGHAVVLTGALVPFAVVLAVLRTMLAVGVLSARARGRLRDVPVASSGGARGAEAAADGEDDAPRAWDRLLGLASYALFYLLVLVPMSLRTAHSWAGAGGTGIEQARLGALLGNAVFAALAMLLLSFRFAPRRTESLRRMELVGVLRGLQRKAVWGIMALVGAWLVGLLLSGTSWVGGVVLVAAASLFGFFSVASYVLSELVQGIVGRGFQGRRLLAYYGVARLGAVVGILLSLLAGAVEQFAGTTAGLCVAIGPVVAGAAGTLWAFRRREARLGEWLATLKVDDESAPSVAHTASTRIPAPVVSRRGGGDRERRLASEVCLLIPDRGARSRVVEHVRAANPGWSDEDVYERIVDSYRRDRHGWTP